VPHFSDASASPGVPDWATAVERVAQDLPGLLPADDAMTVSARIGPLLSRLREPGAGREQAADEIALVLSTHDSARRRLNQLLGPAGLVQRYPEYAGSPLVGYDRYVCPDCGRAWIVLDADEDEQPPELCPDDAATLTFVAGT